jgi:zinc ribbon protein
VSDASFRCARCGEEVPPEADECPACGTPVTRADAPVAPTGAAEPAAAPEDGGALAPEIGRRLVLLRQWSESAAPLGVTLPQLPPWAEETMRAGIDPEGWADILRGVERLAQQRLLAALEIWERETRNRLTRLEAYAIDGRLEREQIEDVLHAARAGEITPALSAYRQVDRVLSLKERHLDQAREELERLVSLLRDMQALGLPTPQEPSEVAEDLERELRSGHLAPLKQRLRTLRSESLVRLETGLRQYVRQYGEYLLQERAEGANIDLEAAELARGAREFAKGRPEDSLRRLRVLAQVHGTGLNRPNRSRPPGGDRPDPGATGASRTA